MKHIIKYMTICLFFGLFSCESLEDTVDVGDGTIRYVGKCSDLVVTPDWESMQLTWKNSIDPGIVNIKVKWSGGGIEKDTLLPKDAEKCLIPNLENYAYTFQVYAVWRWDRSPWNPLLWNSLYHGTRVHFQCFLVSC